MVRWLRIDYCARQMQMLCQTVRPLSTVTVALLPLLLLLLHCLPIHGTETERSRSFQVDYARNVFLKDGLPFRYISGEIHYFRIHPSLWEDRLRRVRAAGLNAVQLYIPWSFHEQKVGRFNFDGGRNISRFIRMAQQNELFVLIRMGPYVCAELDFGGFPWWLTKDQTDISLRTSDKRYFGHVRRWFSALLPILRPLLYKNGGPILMVQIENEYGSVSPCDHNYMRWLRDSVRESLGDDVVLYTTDGPSEKMLRCGSIDGTFATVDFGIQPTEESVKELFELQRNWSRGGPSVNSEFYTTWFSMWGDKSMVRQQIEPLVHDTRRHKFWLLEWKRVKWAGDHIVRLCRAHRRGRKNWPNPPLPLPGNRTGVSIQNVFGVKLADFIALTNSSSNASENRCIHSADGPLNFEAFHQDYGFVWYSAFLEVNGKVLELPELRDHAYVFLDGKFQGNLSVGDKTGGKTKLGLKGEAIKGQKIDILVENIGRLTFPLTKVDPRGLFSPPFIDGKVISDRWVQCGVNLDSVQAKIEAMMNERANSASHPHIDEKHTKVHSISHEPSIFAAKFSTSNIDWAEMDTFLDTRGWGHGVALANGFNLGRYWPLQGPQAAKSSTHLSILCRNPCTRGVRMIVIRVMMLLMSPKGLRHSHETFGSRRPFRIVGAFIATIGAVVATILTETIA
uniref:Beta-galactosidase n=1 Tax=Globodera rostochiensis TaxID=31243 RepID=A0A914HCT6_GLORO